MSEPFLGEIKIISWNYPPKGWAFCNGQQLQINQNQALFALLGTMYGGNGQTTFALPDFRGRAPVHVGAGFIQGQAGGQTAHTLTMGEMPEHIHFANAANVDATSNTPSGTMVLAKSQGASAYAGFQSPQSMLATILTNVGGSQAHNNMQPYLVLNFIIALQGIFPSRN
jgi:microcystin-dependent protein